MELIDQEKPKTDGNAPEKTAEVQDDTSANKTRVKTNEMAPGNKTEDLAAEEDGEDGIAEEAGDEDEDLTDDVGAKPEQTADVQQETPVNKTAVKMSDGKTEGAGEKANDAAEVQKETSANKTA